MLLNCHPGLALTVKGEIHRSSRLGCRRGALLLIGGGDGVPPTDLRPRRRPRRRGRRGQHLRGTPAAAAALEGEPGGLRGAHHTQGAGEDGQRGPSLKRNEHSFTFTQESEYKRRGTPNERCHLLSRVNS